MEPSLERARRATLPGTGTAICGVQSSTARTPGAKGHHQPWRAPEPARPGARKLQPPRCFPERAPAPAAQTPLERSPAPAAQSTQRTPRPAAQSTEGTVETLLVTASG